MQVTACDAVAPAEAHDPTPENAERFVTDAEGRLHDAARRLTRADWIATTHIIPETVATLDEEKAHMSALSTALAREALRYRDAELDLDYDTRRKLDLLTGAATQAGISRASLASVSSRRASRSRSEATVISRTAPLSRRTVRTGR